jgi:hypothetical protein
MATRQQQIPVDSGGDDLLEVVGNLYRSQQLVRDRAAVLYSNRL